MRCYFVISQQSKGCGASCGWIRKPDSNPLPQQIAFLCQYHASFQDPEKSIEDWANFLVGSSSLWAEVHQFLWRRHKIGERGYRRRQNALRYIMKHWTFRKLKLTSSLACGNISTQIYICVYGLDVLIMQMVLSGNFQIQQVSKPLQTRCCYLHT